ncbi:MAG: DUF1622 domain-containing protein [Nitrospiraceae bacterium]|nr:MAG: DUF1622 domain-containing protein [Nitrospiraceae bacterium]
MPGGASAPRTGDFYHRRHNQYRREFNLGKGRLSIIVIIRTILSYFLRMELRQGER